MKISSFQVLGLAIPEDDPLANMPEEEGRKRPVVALRLRTDNGERLRLQIDVAQTLTPTWPQQAEMIIQQWKAIGIHADAKLFERGLFYTRIRNDDHQLTIFSNNGS